MSRSTILVWKMTFEAPSCHISVLRVSPGKNVLCKSRLHAASRQQYAGPPAALRCSCVAEPYSSMQGQVGGPLQMSNHL